MADGVQVKIEGLDQIIAALRSLPDKLRKRALRNALAAGARIVRDAARADAPVLKKPSRYRKAGTVRNAIVVRTSKRDKANGDVGVFVNVKPAKGAKYKTTTTKVLGIKFKGKKLIRASQRGAKSDSDPFYWRWIEFGTKKMSPRPFLREGAQHLPEALRAIESSLGPAIQKLNVPNSQP